MTRGLKRQVQIVREWDRWTRQQGVEPKRRLTGRETLKFYTELQNSQSPLLAFNPRGRDKWEILHGWLVAAGRIPE